MGGVISWFRDRRERRELQRLKEGYYGYVVVDPTDVPPVFDVNPEDFMANDEVDQELTDQSLGVKRDARDMSVKELLTLAAAKIVQQNPGTRRTDIDFEYVRLGEGLGDTVDISFQVGRR